MLKIVVLDSSAESRTRITQRLNQVFQSDLSDLDLLPNLSVKPLALRELKFNAAPDICIVGEEISAQDSVQIAEVRKLFPHSAILVNLAPSALKSLALVEQLVRFGADDVFSSEIGPQDILRKIVIWARKSGPKRKGKLVLFDSAKGGTGITTVVAALGEVLLEQGKKVLLLDLDFDTQDLSRFLQAKPFVNENLQLLLDAERPVSQEFVLQCLTIVWADEELYCMPPAPDSERLNELSTAHSRILLSLLEVIDGEFDCVLVDVGSARSALLRLLYRVADKVVLLLNNDPATLYSSVDRIGKIRAHLASNSDILILDNASSKNGLPNHLLRREFNRAANMEDANWSSSSVPFCRQGSRWPGSGSTLATLGKAANTRALQSLLVKLELSEASMPVDKAGLEKPFAWWPFSKKISDDLAPYLEAPATQKNLTTQPEKILLEFENKGSLLELPDPESLIAKPEVKSAKAQVFDLATPELLQQPSKALVSGFKF